MPKSGNGDIATEFVSIDSKAWLMYLQTSWEVFHLILIYHMNDIEAVGSCPYTYLTHVTELYAPTCPKVAMVAEELLIL